MGGVVVCASDPLLRLFSLITTGTPFFYSAFVVLLGSGWSPCQINESITGYIGTIDVCVWVCVWGEGAVRVAGTFGGYYRPVYPCGKGLHCTTVAANHTLKYFYWKAKLIRQLRKGSVSNILTISLALIRMTQFLI